MNYGRPKRDPTKTLAIVLIGACLMLFVDLFLMGGKEAIFRPVLKKDLTDRQVAQLRDQHHEYLDKGLSSLPADVPRGRFIEEIKVADIPEDFSNSQYPYEEFYEGGIIPPENITPMAGEESGTHEVSADPYFKTEINYNREAAVIHDIPVPEQTGSGNKQTQPNEQIAHLSVPPSTNAQSVNSEPIKSVEPPIQVKQPELQDAALPLKPIRKGTVVIIIDDMGLSSNSRNVENLPGPLTLSYLPYAEGLPERTAYAKKRGHELMVHMPMEPMSGHVDGGPTLLKVDQDEARFMELLRYNLSRFDGYVGVNNHMGSRLTQNRKAMDRVMTELGRRGLYFVDSKTIGNSVAAQAASDAGLAFAERDIFLDHEINSKFIHEALQKVEWTARHKGYAIAIGHPHTQTIEALAAWLPTLKDKGLTLKPASAVVKQRAPTVLVVSAPGGESPRSNAPQAVAEETTKEETQKTENINEHSKIIVTEEGTIVLQQNSEQPTQLHE